MAPLPQAESRGIRRPGVHDDPSCPPRLDPCWSRALTVSPLPGQPRHPRPHVPHEGLQLGIGVLPEVEEPVVDFERLGALAALLVQLAEALIGARQREARLYQPAEGRGVRSLLVGREGRVGLAGGLVR